MVYYGSEQPTSSLFAPVARVLLALSALLFVVSPVIAFFGIGRLAVHGSSPLWDIGINGWFVGAALAVCSAVCAGLATRVTRQFPLLTATLMLVATYVIVLIAYLAWVN